MKKTGIILLLLLPVVLFGDQKHEIEVLASKVPFDFDTRRQVIVIQGELLRQFPSLSVAELISFIANMNFVTRGLFQADPQAAGFNQEQYVVMVNGIPVNNSQTGHHNFSLPFEVEQIEKIEILRGSFSSFFSSSGAGGVINIVTARNNNKVKFSRSSYNTYNASFDLSYRAVSFSAGLKSTDGYMEGIDGKKYFIQGYAEIPFGNNYVDIWGSWVSSKFGARNFYAPFPSFEELERGLGSIRWRKKLNQSTFLVLKLASQYSKDVFKLYRDEPDYYLNNHKTIQNSLEAGITRVREDYSLYIGLSAFADSIDSRGLRNGKEEAALGQHSRKLFSLFSEFSGEKNRFFMNTGFRITQGSYGNLSGHLLLGILLGNTRISTSIHRTFRIPTYTELYYTDPVHVSNPSLKPEKIWGYNISFEHSSSNRFFKARLFFNSSSLLIDWKRDLRRNIWISENINRGKYYGLDLEFSWSSPNTVVKTLYTFQRAVLRENSSLKSYKYRYYFPEHNLSLNFKRNFNFISFYSALKIEKEKFTRKSYVYLNLRTWKEFGNFQVFFEIYNLFNNRVEKIPGLPEPPRSYGIGFGYRF